MIPSFKRFFNRIKRRYNEWKYKGKLVIEEKSTPITPHTIYKAMSYIIYHRGMLYWAYDDFLGYSFLQFSELRHCENLKYCEAVFGKLYNLGYIDTEIHPEKWTVSTCFWVTKEGYQYYESRKPYYSVWSVNYWIAAWSNQSNVPFFHFLVAQSVTYVFVYILGRFYDDIWDYLNVLLRKLLDILI